MEASYENLCPIYFNEQERRCAVIMALVNTSGKATNRQNADKLGINLRTVQILRKRLEEVKDPKTTIQKAPKALEEVISSKGNIMPPHIIETGLRVNTDIYLKVLSTVVFPWIQLVAGNCLWL